MFTLVLFAVAVGVWFRTAAGIIQQVLGEDKKRKEPPTKTGQR